MYDRADAIAHLATRYADYLAVANRAAVDAATTVVDGVTVPGAKVIVDDALLGLGYRRSELTAVQAADDDEADEWVTMLDYVALRQLARDLGGQVFDISSQGDSLKLSQLRGNLMSDLAEAKAAALAVFGSLSAVPAPGGPTAWKLDFLGPVEADEHARA